MSTLAEQLEKELREIAEKIIDERELSLAKENVNEIINAIMPEIDKIISKKIKVHMAAIATYMMKIASNGE